MSEYSGLWPVMLTAFEEDGSLDWGGVDALVDFYLEAGVSGLFAVCLSSEMYDLTSEERLQLVERIVRRVDGRVPTAATGTFGGSVAAQAECSRRVADLGVDVVIVLTNQFASESDGEQGFLEALEPFLEATEPLKLGLYECPLPYHLCLTSNAVAWAAATSRFAYIKETSCDIELVKKKILVSAGTPLGIFDAHTPSALAALQSGAAGVSPIAANFFPELYAWLCAEHNAQPERAVDLQRMLDVMEGVVRTNYPVGAKRFLQLRGVPIGLTCRSGLDLDTRNEKLLNSLQQTVNELVQSMTTVSSQSGNGSQF